MKLQDFAGYKQTQSPINVFENHAGTLILESSVLWIPQFSPPKWQLFKAINPFIGRTNTSSKRKAGEKICTHTWRNHLWISHCPVWKTFEWNILENLQWSQYGFSLNDPFQIITLQGLCFAYLNFAVKYIGKSNLKKH